jgi:hypothetical protein
MAVREKRVYMATLIPRIAMNNLLEVLVSRVTKAGNCTRVSAVYGPDLARDKVSIDLTLIPHV